jgi:hypothetical protein
MKRTRTKQEVNTVPGSEGVLGVVVVAHEYLLPLLYRLQRHCKTIGTLTDSTSTVFLIYLR